MALHFRKTKKLGPFRLTFTENGMGYSVGNKLLRIGHSATGKTTISGGSHGVYYRKQLSSSSKTGKTTKNTAAHLADSQTTSAQDIPLGCYPAVLGLFFLMISPMFGLVCWDFSVFKWLAIAGAILICCTLLIGLITLIIDSVKGSNGKQSEDNTNSPTIKVEYNESSKEIFSKIPKEVFFKLRYEKSEDKEYYWVPTSVWEKALADPDYSEAFIASNELQ